MTLLYLYVSLFMCCLSVSISNWCSLLLILLSDDFQFFSFLFSVYVYLFYYWTTWVALINTQFAVFFGVILPSVCLFSLFPCALPCLYSSPMPSRFEHV